jgi:UDP-glucuronate 4-epimerase
MPSDNGGHRVTTPILVTGVAGFVGRAVAARLLSRGEAVVGVDNFNTYYDPRLKETRAQTLAGHAGFQLQRIDIADADVLAALVKHTGVRRVVHLAAQAGVRYSIDHPFAYERSNLLGHLAVLEACRHAGDIEHLVYASSSSVYGDRTGDGAFSEDDPAVAPVSLYAATKRANELMGASYAYLYGLPQSALRFFTVYGPWGRPDMAYFSFTRKILAGQPIEVFGEGKMSRDFTYIDDIVDGVVGVLDHPPPRHGHRTLNIGDNHPVGLMRMIETLEGVLGVPAVKILRPMQPGDVTTTYANIDAIHALTGYSPQVRLEEGLARFADWYRDFHGLTASTGAPTV